MIASLFGLLYVIVQSNLNIIFFSTELLANSDYFVYLSFDFMSVDTFNGNNERQTHCMYVSNYFVSFEYTYLKQRKLPKSLKIHENMNYWDYYLKLILLIWTLDLTVDSKHVSIIK